jgi:hypothetical protein
MTRSSILSQKAELLLALQNAHRWLRVNGWSGYDPYDLRGAPVAIWAYDRASWRRPHARLMRIMVDVADAFCPLASRKALRIRPKINPKALALSARAYLNLYSCTSDEAYLSLALNALEVLQDHKAKGYVGTSWGYPFDWQSQVFLPSGTPSGVVSAIVGDAFWRAYLLTDIGAFRTTCFDVCEFFLGSLDRDELDASTQCFSYTPLDHMHVLNATSLIAEFLVRIGTNCGIPGFIQEGLRGAAYVIRNQGPDGEWQYFGPEDRLPPSIDHYHTGFVLRTLDSIAEVTQNETIRAAVGRGASYYWQNLFTADGLPKFSPKSLYPINAHTVAESLLVLSAFDGRWFNAQARLRHIVQWVSANMQDRDGHFYYSLRPAWKVKMPFLRWSHAWLFLGLSEVFLRLSDKGVAAAMPPSCVHHHVRLDL